MKLFDLHQDIFFHLNNRELFDDVYQTNFDLLKKAGIEGVIATAFPFTGSFGDEFDSHEKQVIENELKAYNKFAEQNDEWEIVKTKRDALQIGTDDKRYIILNVEGLNFFEGAPEDWGLLERWVNELHLSSVTLVWNKANNLAGGIEHLDVGLSNLGVELIKWLEERDIILDCAHMNDKTFMDVYRVAERPLLVSHTAARSIYDSPRNLSDEQMGMVARSEGVVGVFCSGKYISDDQDISIEKLIDHIDHIVEIVGEDHIALGTDFGGIISKKITGLESIDNVEVLLDSLKKRGYTDSTLKKLSFDNAYRVVTNHLGV